MSTGVLRTLTKYDYNHEGTFLLLNSRYKHPMRIRHKLYLAIYANKPDWMESMI